MQSTFPPSLVKKFKEKKSPGTNGLKLVILSTVVKNNVTGKYALLYVTIYAKNRSTVYLYIGKRKFYQKLFLDHFSVAFNSF